MITIAHYAISLGEGSGRFAALRTVRCASGCSARCRSWTFWLVQTWFKRLAEEPELTHPLKPAEQFAERATRPI